MKVLALTPNLYGRSPGQRSSIELWEKVLEPAGIVMHHSPFETEGLRRVIYGKGRSAAKAGEMVRAYGRRLRSIGSIDDYDAVLVYREAAMIGPALIERLVARRGKPIIYQLDDPLYVPYQSPFSGYFSYLKFFGKVGEICRLSKVVIVNSSHHRAYAEQFSRNVWQIPSVVDGDVYRPGPRPEREGGPLALGWTGSASTVGNLGVIEDPVRELARRRSVRLHLVGVDREPFNGVDTTLRPWSAETEVEDVRKIDVGLLPLPLNEWNKRKFFLKLVQYMALGIPAVCTPLGSNPEGVDHGETGFLADSSEEWVKYLELLVDDAELRARMGERAAQVARERFTLQSNAERTVGACKAALE